MDSAVIQTSTFNKINPSASAESFADDRFAPDATQIDAGELKFELGLWLSSLESFLNIRNHTFAEDSRAKAATRDWTKEFRLTHSTLLLCSELTFQLGKVFQNQDDPAQKNGEIDSVEDWNAVSKELQINSNEIYKLSQALKDSVLLNECLLRAAPLKFGEWTAWSNFLAEKFKNIEIFPALIENAETEGGDFLPEVFQLLESKPLPTATATDLKLVLPRFGKILKWLSVVERMLKNDEPLKPTLLIFARVHEQVSELVKYVDNRLLRFPDEEDALFAALDGTAYTASIELRKVYNYELAGVAEIRPTPAVYARIETAYSLLNDSFQQTLVNFAQLIDPRVEGAELFPNFQIKLKQSLVLRQEMWEILQSVKKAEQNPEKNLLDALHKQLNDFLETSLHFLFYKDMETVERFIEEVLITADKKDLVPILHRFGAYLETLFGQINMRTLLAKHPFNN